MGLRITSQLNRISVLGNLRENVNDYQISLQRLSSGVRLLAASDDPGDSARTNIATSKIDALNVVSRSLVRLGTVTTIAEQALAQIGEHLIAIKSKVSAALSTGVNDETRVAGLQSEVDQLIRSIDRIAATTSFNGKNLLDGTAAYTITQVDNRDVIKDVQVYSLDIGERPSAEFDVRVHAKARPAYIFMNIGWLNRVASNGDVIVRFAEGEKGQMTDYVDVTIPDNTRVYQLPGIVNGFLQEAGVDARVVRPASNNNFLMYNAVNYGPDKTLAFSQVGGTGTWSVSFGSTRGASNGSTLSATVNGTPAVGTDYDNPWTMYFNDGTLDARIELASGVSLLMLQDVTFSVARGGLEFLIGNAETGQDLLHMGLPDLSSFNLGNSEVTMRFASGGKIIKGGWLSDIIGGGAYDLVHNAGQANTIIDSTVKQVNNIRVKLAGAVAYLVNPLEEVLGEKLLGLNKKKSDLVDVDYAAELTETVRSQLTAQAGVYAVNALNISLKSVMDLLEAAPVAQAAVE